MNSKNYNWLEDVLADVQSFCIENGLKITSSKLAKARLAFDSERKAIRKPAHPIQTAGDSEITPKTLSS